MGNQAMAAGMTAMVQDHSSETLKTFLADLAEDQRKRLKAAMTGELRPDQLALALEAFSAINTKKTGYIDLSEFKVAMEALRIKMSDADTEEIFKSFDLNNDWKLDFEEYVNILQCYLQGTAGNYNFYEPSGEVTADNALLPPGLAETSAEIVAAPQPEEVLKAAVLDGQATEDAIFGEEEEGKCWQGEDSVHCPQRKDIPTGQDSGLEFPVRVAHRDFKLVLEFKLKFRQGTDASVGFCSGVGHKHEQHIILDGPGETLRLEGGSFGHRGPQNTFGPAPSAGDKHTLIVTRFNDEVTISLDGNCPFPEKPMPASISTVFVRPWANKFEIFEFKLMTPVTDPKLLV